MSVSTNSVSTNTARERPTQSSAPRVPGLPAGLTTAEVAERVAAGAVNDVGEPASRSLASIIRANVFTRFNALLGGLWVVVLALGSYQDALFGLIVVINTVIGIVQEVRAKKALDTLSLLGQATARVRRDELTVTLDPRQVVLDDVVVLGPGDKVIVDGTVITGDDLELDESLLTGEADPVERGPGATVLSGSFVVGGTGAYRATAVGRDAYAARLAGQARRFSLVRSELRDGLNRFLRGVTWFLVPTSVLLVTTQLIVSGQDLRSALLGSVAGVITMVPEGLVLLTSIAFAVGVVRLGRRRVLVQELPAIEGLARVDTVCLDKTGTLTEPHMALASVVPLDAAVAVDDVLANLAASDPAPNASIAAIARRYPSGPTWSVEQAVSFSSTRKWSGVTFAGHGSWVLGAPEVLLPDRPTVLAEAGRHAEAGLRVLLLASAQRLQGESPPRGLRPAALVLLEQPIRPDAAATLQYFAEEGVAVKVLSGDNPRTVGSIARRLAIPGAEHPYDARTLPQDPGELAAVAETVSVFGRVTPEQKRTLVRALQGGGHDVAMTGDGVNDVLALKDADIGVAMGNGSDASKAVAKIVLLDSRFADLPAVVGEGRRVLGNIERVARLFLTKTVYACLMALAVGVARLPFPFLPRHLTLVSALAIGVPAFVLALVPNTARVRRGFVPRVLRDAVPAGILAGIGSLVAYGVARSESSSWLAQDRTTAVLTLFAISMWVLGTVAAPLTPWKWLLIGSMVGLFVVALTVPTAAMFFALDLSDWPTQLPVAGLCTVGAVALLEVLRWGQRRHPALITGLRHPLRGRRGGRRRRAPHAP
ncbi:MAG TPA: HAD-IC family P-type ATPase [Actinomycetales bacterium]|nr:HAD-IC family P-type ATPase [Actinomycetales bacterium]